MKVDVSKEAIDKFLQGKNPQQYIVAIESSYYENKVQLIINHPKKGKYIETDTYKPFLWMKHDAGDVLFGGDRIMARKKLIEYGLTMESLKTKKDGSSESPERLISGYRYLITGKGSYSQLLGFFKEAGIDLFGEHRSLFMTFSPTEQYLIQTGKRLFKGIEDYNDLHRLQFDLETEGLDSRRHRIFQIGIKDNRGFETILEVTGDNPKELRDNELNAIEKLFYIIEYLKPDIVSGYNSENFDFNFMVGRCNRLGTDIKFISKTLSHDKKIYIKPNSTIKFGAETEYYNQTFIWGFNVIDIAHAVRRAQAINSDIKGWGLKYITKFSEIEKPNRVYVPGDIINKTWADIINKYAFNNVNGDWYKLSNEKPLKEEYEEVDGASIVRRYLLDDLWETEQVDFIFNQASFLLAKLLPTTYTKTSTMGNSSVWKLIMATWSYENRLAIPSLEERKTFTGGLSRLLEVGYAKNVVKLDYAALYPNIQLSWGIFPDLDITGAMMNLLLYVAETRDEYKDLMKKYGKMSGKETDPEKKKEYSKLESQYDRKQLPLKILANSFFGAYGASYLFPWGDTDCAEETTCRGRQYLRKMISFFKDKYGFKPLVGDSVTHNTPIYLRDRNGLIDILPICDLYNSDSKFLGKDDLRDYEDKEYEILTRNGWKEINYVYRHKTSKKIHRVTTKDRLVNVTEDHSLFQEGVQIKPKSLNLGDRIDVYEVFTNNTIDSLDLELSFLYGLFLGGGEIKENQVIIKSNCKGIFKVLIPLISKHFNNIGIIKKGNKLLIDGEDIINFFQTNFFTSSNFKKVPQFILNSNEETKKAFIYGLVASNVKEFDGMQVIKQKSDVAMAGIVLLIKELNLEHSIKLEKEVNTTIYNSNEVTSNKRVKNPHKESYVYDISTEDGTFIGGIGGVILKNTDGFNFSIPDNVDDFTYTSPGNHRFTEKDKEYKGLEAVVAEFNDDLPGRMGLSIDEIALSTINFSRKNYADLLLKNGKIKVKLVGNTVKSKKMPGYIEDFLDKAVRMLLDGKGNDFIEYYYSYVEKIYNYEIPLVKIASKSKVKQSISEYHARAKKTNIKGQPLSKQAHMELVIKEGLNPDLGEMIYYVNTGKKASDGDCAMVLNKVTGKKELVLNAKLIPNNQIENNPELTTDEYNVPKYLTTLNKRIGPLLVCFNPDIRNKIIIKMVKDKATKKLALQPRNYFTIEESELCAGQPIREKDQDDYERDLMTMADSEFRFWVSTNKIPNDIDLDVWENNKKGYIERMRIKRDEDIIKEQTLLFALLKDLDLKHLEKISNTNKLPDSINNLVYYELIDDEIYIMSRRLVEINYLNLKHITYGTLSDILSICNKEAIFKDKYYDSYCELYDEGTIKETELITPFSEFEKNYITQFYDGTIKNIHELILEEPDTDNEEIEETDEDGETVKTIKKKFEDVEDKFDDISFDSIPVNKTEEIKRIDKMIELHEDNPSDFMLNQYKAKKERTLLEKVDDCIDCDEDEYNF